MIVDPFLVRHLYRSPGHNYFGHHGAPPGTHPAEECREVRLWAGRGIEGDRFFNFKPGYKGQVTFFAHEVYEDLCQQLDIWDKSPAVLRRNIITRGADLNELIGQKFEVQGVPFFGMSDCAPCYWMDSAFGVGAERALAGRGGLRARVLGDGVLRVNA